jgi:hypothetical protein
MVHGDRSNIGFLFVVNLNKLANFESDSLKEAIGWQSLGPLIPGKRLGQARFRVFALGRKAQPTRTQKQKEPKGRDRTGQLLSRSRQRQRFRSRSPYHLGDSQSRGSGLLRGQIGWGLSQALTTPSVDSAVPAAIECQTFEEPAALRRARRSVAPGRVQQALYSAASVS